MSIDSWGARLRGWKPRAVALTWAVYAALTSMAYMDARPEQLEVPATILPVRLWAAWAAAGVLLTLGAVFPPTASPRLRRIARILRVVGLALIAGLLTMWTEAYMGYGDRGWVSGKNYLALLVAAGFSAVIAGRDGGGETWPQKSSSASSQP